MMQITVVERAQKIQIQEQEIVRRERELDSKVRKPAEAEKFRLEKLAEANKSVWLHFLSVHSYWELLSQKKINFLVIFQYVCHC